MSRRASIGFAFGKKSAKKLRKVRRSLQCEALEDRRVLATFTVINDLDAGAGSLRQAIDDANSMAGADDIVFDASLAGGTITLTSDQLLIEESVTIDGTDAPGLVISGGGALRVFAVADADDPAVPNQDVAIRNLTISGGSTFAQNLPGGGILNFENLALENVTVSGNTAGTSGGGIANIGGNLSISESEISGNVAEQSMPYVYNPDTMMNDGPYSAFGGGIHNTGGSLTVTDSIISGNESRESAAYAELDNAVGGGITSLNYGSLTIVDSTVDGNTSSFNAGGIYARYNTAVSITGSTISNNTGGVDTTDSPNAGGILLRSDGGGTQALDVLIEDTTISGNTILSDANDGNAFPYGGGAYIRGFGEVRILNSMVTGNAATGTPDSTEPFDYLGPRGGGLFFRTRDPDDNPLNIDLSDTTLEGNMSYRQGSAIATRGGGVSTANMIYDYGPLNLDLANVTISGNMSGDGTIWQWAPGVLVPGVANTNLSGVTIENNISEEDGGALNSSSGATVIIENSTLRNNMTSGTAGAVRSNGVGIGAGNPATELIIRDSTISGNSAEGGGGGVVSYDANLTIVNSTISGNTARNNGGGIALYEYVNETYNPGGSYETSATIINSTITGNTQLSNMVDFGYGGGIYNNGLHEVTLLNSIVAGNKYIANEGDPATDNDIVNVNPDTSLVTVGFTLVGTNDNGPQEPPFLMEGNPDADGNIVGGPMGGVIDPLLGPLADNGGPTETHALLAGSPAIDTGDPTSMAGMGDIPANDQRGYTSRVENGRIDMGSYELGAIAPGDPCDFNDDGACDITDLDELTMEISAGLMNLEFDLNGDGMVNLDDVTDAGVGWLAQAGAKNLASGNAYLVGDANLDGVVDVTDFNTWNNNKFTTTGKWSQGDFNADGTTDVSDFNAWNNNKFNSALESAASAASSNPRLRAAQEAVADRTPQAALDATSERSSLRHRETTGKLRVPLDKPVLPDPLEMVRVASARSVRSLIDLRIEAANDELAQPQVFVANVGADRTADIAVTPAQTPVAAADAVPASPATEAKLARYTTKQDANSFRADEAVQDQSARSQVDEFFAVFGR